MKVKLWMTLCFLILVMAGCFGQKTLDFHGKSEKWEVKYQADIRGEDSESTSFKIRYIGEGEPPEKIAYKIDSVSGGAAGNAHLKSGVLDSAGSSCSGCAITREDHKISVTIEWDGETERMVLEND